jgi:hypothetical protein
VDQHLKGFQSIGAEAGEIGGILTAECDNLTGGDVFFDMVTVGATVNVMLAAAKAKGNTVIYNAAKEPHIVDLANFLNTLGADVNGAGTSEIVINGVRPEDLHPIEYTTIPDRIEAGTFMSAIIATRGKGIIKNVFPAHLTFFTDKLLKMGANIEMGSDVQISESIEITEAGVITPTKTPVAFPSTTLIVGSYKLPTEGSDDWKTITFVDGKASVAGLKVGDTVCVKYFYRDASARQFKVPSDIIPSVVKAVAKVPEFASSTEGGDFSTKSRILCRSSSFLWFAIITTSLLISSLQLMLI